MSISSTSPRIVSLVPSWTETLFWAELNVVGRTRFCIHPKELVKVATPLGGTKGVDLDKLLSLKPDFVIVDKEENRKELAEQLTELNIELLVSHVVDFLSASQFLNQIGNLFQSEKLIDLGLRYKNFHDGKFKISKTKFIKNCILPQINENTNNEKIILENILVNAEYIIWKNPFMVVGQNTFIAEVLKCAGIHISRAEKYPTVSEDELKKKFCIFSSEPYPFAKDFNRLQQEGFDGILVDGEKVSWYGIRNLRFLESSVED